MIAYRGNDDFGPSAAPEWNQQIFDLDTLTEKYRGGREKLDVFLNSLVRFQPSAIDPNMFLVNWSVTGGTPVFPEVSLVFNGKKNGVMPFGRRSTDTKTQTATVQSPAGPITITYRVRTPIYEWISATEGAGAINDPTIVSAATTTYLVPGQLVIPAGSDILGGITLGAGFIAAGVRVNDILVMILHDPSVPITTTAPVPLSAIVKVLGVQAFSLRITPVANIIRKSYAVNTTVGYHTANLPVTVVSMRIGCGISSILGVQADLIGPLLVASYFQAIVTPDLAATEVVPNRYWKNRQELITSLTPIPC